MTAGERLLRRLVLALLALYPRPFRREFGGDIPDAHVDRYRTARRRGRVAALLCAVTALADACWSAGHEWKEAGRDAWRARRGKRPARSMAVHDLRLAARSLRRHPGFAATVVVTLALGIGANTAVFSLVDAVLLDPLPELADPRSLVAVYDATNADAPRGGVPFPTFISLRAGNRTLQKLAAYTDEDVAFQAPGRSALAPVGIVSGEYFSLLGVKPQLGRVVEPRDDEAPLASPVVVISDAVWSREFDRNRNVLGRSVRLGPTSFTVIGVAPRGFRGTHLSRSPEFWVPLTMIQGLDLGGFLSGQFSRNLFTTFRGFGRLQLVGRLAPGVPADAAAADLTRVLHASRPAPASGVRREARVDVVPIRAAAAIEDRMGVVRLSVPGPRRDRIGAAGRPAGRAGRHFGRHRRDCRPVSAQSPRRPAADLGFDPGPIAAATVELRLHGYSYQRAAGFYRQIVARLSDMPGIEAAAVASHVPVAPAHTSGVRPADAPESAPGTRVGRSFVTPGYFRALGVPVLSGRDFSSNDTPRTPLVAVLSESAARALWPDGQAVGRRVVDIGDRAFLVVGIVGDTQYESLGEADPPFLFTSILQEPVVGKVSVIARERGGEDTRAVVRRAMLEADPIVAPTDVRHLSHQVEALLVPQRFGSALLTSLGVLALVIAAVGIYASLASAVAQRRKDVGIRIALGAARGDVLPLVLCRTAAAVAGGLAMGLVISAAVARAVTHFLFGITPLDATAYVVSMIVLVSILGAVSLIPARRAWQIDPIETLRGD